MEEGKRGLRVEEEMVETALAAAGVALLVSGMKHLLFLLPPLTTPGLPCSCPLSAVLVMAPSPFLFLLLNIVVASIVVVSLRPASGVGVGVGVGAERKKARKISNEKEKFEESATAAVAAAEAEVEAEAEAEGGVEAEELNRRAEAFIAAFRRQLSADSSSSSGKRGRQRSIA